jgi:TatD-related deoxyribonuclease
VPLPAGLPVVDHHCHLSPAGEGVVAARRFRAAGGTHLFLATQNYGPSIPRSLEEYEEQFATTEALARRVRDEAGVEVYLVVAPYPIDLVQIAPEVGLEPARAVQVAAIDRAGQWVREHRAVALGEVGRPHFPIPPDIAGATDAVFLHALAVAHDVDCPVVVHSDDLDPEGFRRLAEEADRAGVRRERVVKHYARNRLPTSQRSSVTPSYLARRELVDSLWKDPGPWFLETDFLDDPRRPGAVLDLATVPRRAAALAARSGEPEGLWVPFSDSIRAVYGFVPQVS